jgi:hypothetical protein
MPWKYVIMQVGNSEVPVIFPERMVHLLVVELLQDYFVHEVLQAASFALSEASIEKLREAIKPIAAGSLEMVVTATHGDSETLHISSRPEDKARINSHPYDGGIYAAPPDEESA